MAIQVPSTISFRKISYKKWSYSEQSDTAAWIGSGDFRVTAGPETAMLVSKEDGIIFKGPTAFTSLPNKVLFGGIYKFNPLSLSTIPSTIVSPISTFTLTFPMSGVKKVMTRLIADLRGLLF